MEAEADEEQVSRTTWIRVTDKTIRAHGNNVMGRGVKNTN